MTAIRDAMTRAGVDTTGAELRAAALDALKNNRGNVEKAAMQLGALVIKRRDLLRTLTLDFVRRLAGEPEALERVAVTERQRDVTVDRHKRHRRRTREERAAALRVAAGEADAMRSVFDRRVNGRPIGDLAWGELTKMVQNNADDAASFLKLGIDYAANALLLRKVKSFAQVEDHATPVRRIITAVQLQTFIDEAEREAPLVVEAGMREYAQTIAEKTTMKGIAA